MTAPVVRAEMLIRKPAADVFNAFADPAVTTKFWFTKSSGKLEAGKRVHWDWEMYDVGDDAFAQALDSTQGFNLVLAAAKAWLEHGINLNLVADKAPDHNVAGWETRA